MRILAAGERGGGGGGLRPPPPTYHHLPHHRHGQPAAQPRAGPAGQGRVSAAVQTVQQWCGRPLQTARRRIPAECLIPPHSSIQIWDQIICRYSQLTHKKLWTVSSQYTKSLLQSKVGFFFFFN